MPSPSVSVLSKEDIVLAAKRLRWTRALPKWTVLVDGREFPARPLILEAAGVPPNDPTNSHQAVAILQEKGFEVRYGGKIITSSEKAQTDETVTDDFIRSLRGICKGQESMIDDREGEHRLEKNRFAHD